MENLFGQLKSKIRSAFPGPETAHLPTENTPNNPHELLVQHTRESVENLTHVFLENCRTVQTQLPQSQAESFAMVTTLPAVFEQKIRDYAVMPENAGRDFADKKTTEMLKSYLLNYNTKGSGIIYKTMEKILDENAIVPTGENQSYDVTIHQFFKTAPGILIESIAKLIAAERVASAAE